MGLLPLQKFVLYQLVNESCLLQNISSSSYKKCKVHGCAPENASCTFCCLIIYLLSALLLLLLFFSDNNTLEKIKSYKKMAWDFHNPLLVSSSTKMLNYRIWKYKCLCTCTAHVFIMGLFI